jgi:hypothetical protein
MRVGLAERLPPSNSGMPPRFGLASSGALSVTILGKWEAASITGGSPSVPSTRSRTVTTVPGSMPSHSAASGEAGAWLTVV